MSSLQQRSLSLYRSLLRAARKNVWSSAEEADYIRQEARQQFRAAQAARYSEEQAAAALEEGERRLELALHYGIAWPRLHHANQFEKVPYFQAPQLDAAEEPEQLASGVKDRSIAEKLAAAARRRRERLALQQRQQQEAVAEERTWSEAEEEEESGEASDGSGPEHSSPK